ncbi:MAG TPA: hypothetical protein VK158_01925 [Acidobacteriota bacterium]|nr:hypothetical protein [Acidobacteriota bacterium]
MNKRAEAAETTGESLFDVGKIVFIIAILVVVFYFCFRFVKDAFG